MVTTVTAQSRQLIQCLTNNNLTRVATAEMVLTVPMVLDKGTTIAKLKKATKPQAIIEAITNIIIRAMDSFNVSQKITDAQAPILAIDLLEIMEHDCIEDILLMFKYARQGKIGGKLFRIDNQVVLSEWMPEYLNLKAEEREKRHANDKARANSLIKLDWDAKALENFKALNIGVNESENNKQVLAPGMGSNMRDWLGNEPLTPEWGQKDNAVNKEFEYQNKSRTKTNI